MSRSAFGPDPLKILGTAAVVLNVVVGAAVFELTHLVSASGGHPFRLPYYLAPGVGVLGLAIAWIGWRRIGAGLMALTGVAYAIGGAVFLLSWWFPAGPLLALVGGVWVGAALSWRQPSAPSHVQRA